MDINQLTAWAAGRVEGGGMLIVSTEEGPAGRPYMAISVEIDVDDEMTANRLLTVANNGTVDRYSNKTVWHLGGYAAVRSFAKTIWPYLTPETKRTINETIKTYKKLKAGLKNGGSNARI